MYPQSSPQTTEGRRRDADRVQGAVGGRRRAARRRVESPRRRPGIAATAATSCCRASTGTPPPGRPTPPRAGRSAGIGCCGRTPPAIRAAGFSWVWFPPPSDSLAPQGYIPRRWNVLDSAFGTEAELRAAIAALGPVRAMADVVLNHRVGVHTAGADFEDPPFPDNRAAIARDDESGVGTGNPDTGERHPAGRDLDHTNPGVRAAVKAYLRRLKSVGFRGLALRPRQGLPRPVRRRVQRRQPAPAFSVGEVFDQDRATVTGWVDSTGGRRRPSTSRRATCCTTPSATTTTPGCARWTAAARAPAG